MNELFDLGIRATLLLGVALMGWWVLKPQSAQMRSAWLRTAVLCLLALPVWIWAGPEFRFDIPWAEKPAPIMMMAAEGAPVVAAAPAANWSWVWAAVAALLALRMTMGGVALMRLWSRARQAGDDLTDELYQALAKLDVSRPVDFRMAPIGSPMTFGIRRACVVVPSDFDTWPEAHREAALMHEAAHIRRFDCGWQWLATSVRALLWCHPLVWWLAHAIKDEAELAADERVIAAGLEATDYAAALVEIARTKSHGRTPIAGTALMREGQLSRRVSSALESRRAGFTPIGALGMMAAAMGAVVAVGGLRPQLPQADVLVVKGKPTPIVFNMPAEDVPLELEDIVVTTDAGLDPLPTIKPAKTAVAPKWEAKKVVVLKQAKPRPSLPEPAEAVEPSAPVTDLRSHEATIRVTVEDTVALAPRSKDREARVVFVEIDDNAIAPSAPKTRVRTETFAYSFAELADVKDLKELKQLPAAHLEKIATWASVSEREEFKKHMEQLRKEMTWVYSDADAKKMTEKSKRAMEEAMKAVEKAAAFYPPVPPMGSSAPKGD
ncbi:MAG: M56 family metallopeptidase [Methanoregulaceae archaeon]|nr:M56 family metallopeptidase [Methanoregulaceae archaeon]